MSCPNHLSWFWTVPAPQSGALLAIPLTASPVPFASPLNAPPNKNLGPLRNPLRYATLYANPPPLITLDRGCSETLAGLPSPNTGKSSVCMAGASQPCPLRTSRGMLIPPHPCFVKNVGFVPKNAVTTEGNCAIVKSEHARSSPNWSCISSFLFYKN